jgi:hypothetical protein
MLILHEPLQFVEQHVLDKLSRSNGLGEQHLRAMPLRLLHLRQQWQLPHL